MLVFHHDDNHNPNGDNHICMHLSKPYEVRHFAGHTATSIDGSKKCASHLGGGSPGNGASLDETATAQLAQILAVAADIQTRTLKTQVARNSLSTTVEHGSVCSNRGNDGPIVYKSVVVMVDYCHLLPGVSVQNRINLKKIGNYICNVASHLKPLITL